MTDAELLAYLTTIQACMRADDLDALNGILLEATKTTDKLHIIAALRCTFSFRHRLAEWNTLLDHATSAVSPAALRGLERVHK
jgi:hypothetical protein